MNLLGVFAMKCLWAFVLAIFASALIANAFVVSEQVSNSAESPQFLEK